MVEDTDAAADQRQTEFPTEQLCSTVPLCCRLAPTHGCTIRYLDAMRAFVSKAWTEQRAPANSRVNEWCVI